MTPVFPLRLFPPTEHWLGLPGAALSGGTPISGPPQTAEASAGGWWVYEYSADLRGPQQFAAWRAILGQLNSGVGLIEVPILDILRSLAQGARVLTPFSDLSTFSDGSQFAGQAVAAELVLDVFMPASPAPIRPPTSARIQLQTADAAIIGGEYFSLISPSGAKRLHMITTVATVSDDTFDVSVIPPFREDTPAGTAVDFNNPTLTAKADVGSVRDAWPRMTPPFLAKPKIVFVESGFVVPSEG